MRDSARSKEPSPCSSQKGSAVDDDDDDYLILGDDLNMTFVFWH